MQLKLLQTYKILSNFAISLIMEFIPFIILGYMLPKYSLSYSLTMMFIFWAAQNLFLVIFNKLFQKLYITKPQIFLLFRVVPIVCCEICILFLYTNNIFLILLTAVFSGLENSFNYQPTDIIWNFVSEGADERKLAFTTFLDQMGWLIAGIVGGAFLDYIPQWIVVAFSLTLFVASAVPIFIFYFKFRKTPYFNVDYISSIAQREAENQKLKKIQKSFIRDHFITFVLIAPTWYLFYYLTSTTLYLSTGSFFITGTVTSIYDGLYGFACLYCGKFLTKVDGKKYACMVAIYMCIVMLVIYFVPNLIVRIAVFESAAFIQPVLNMYKHHNFLDKARILGLGNKVTLNQNNATISSNAICYTVGAIGGMLPIVIFSVCMALVGSAALSRLDSKLNKNLVDFLSGNDS